MSYSLKFNEPYDLNDGPCIVFDLDGTLCDIGHRLHHIKPPDSEKVLRHESVDELKKAVLWKPDYDTFNKECISDKLHAHISAIYDSMCRDTLIDGDYTCVVVTGRSGVVKNETIEWLDRHHIWPHYLYMRPRDCQTSDVDYKLSVVKNYLVGAKVLFVIEDRDSVVDMWRSLGYKCLQCQKGAY